MKSKIIIGIVAAVAVLGGGYTVSRMDFIGTGKVGIVYNYKDGVQDTVLTPGMHFIAPMNKVKEFSTNAIGNMAVAFVGTSGVQMGWLASQADMLAEDWIFAEE